MSSCWWCERGLPCNRDKAPTPPLVAASPVPPVVPDGNITRCDNAAQALVAAVVEAVGPTREDTSPKPQHHPDCDNGGDFGWTCSDACAVYQQARHADGAVGPTT